MGGPGKNPNPLRGFLKTTSIWEVPLKTRPGRVLKRTCQIGKVLSNNSQRVRVPARGPPTSGSIDCPTHPEIWGRSFLLHVHAVPYLFFARTFPAETQALELADNQATTIRKRRTTSSFYSMLRTSSSGPAIVLTRRISAGLLQGNTEIGPPTGRWPAGGPILVPSR